MQNFLDKIASYGLPAGIPEFEAKRLRLINLISVFWASFLVILLLILTFPVFQPIPAYITLGMLSFLALPPLFGRFGYFSLSKVAFLTQFVVFGIVLAMLFGSQTRYEWCIIVVPSSAFMLFEKPRHLAFLSIGIVGFVLIKAIYANIPPLIEDVNEVPFFDYLIGFSICLFIYFLVSAFKIETIRNERLANKRNAQLIENQKLIEAQNQNLIEANLLLDRKQQTLESLNQELQQFASLASHDMKEPLRTIASFATLLRRRMPNDEQNTDFLNFIEDAAKRMNAMLDDLIRYARAGVERSPKTPIDLNLILENVKMNLFQVISSKNASIESTHLPVVWGHKTLLTQLFQNIVGNALKYSAEGASPEIQIRFIKKDDNLLLAFRDNGIGIAPENLQKIFEPFRRLHSRTEFEGSGIGLATCKKIADAYGGQIWAESEIKKGTVFYVEFPGEMLVAEKEAIVEEELLIA